MLRKLSLNEFIVFREYMLKMLSDSGCVCGFIMILLLNCSIRLTSLQFRIVDRWNGTVQTHPLERTDNQTTFYLKSIHTVRSFGCKRNETWCLGFITVLKREWCVLVISLYINCQMSQLLLMYVTLVHVSYVHIIMNIACIIYRIVIVCTASLMLLRSDSYQNV